MGFKNKLEKMKSFLFDDDDKEELPKKQPKFKKEEVKVEVDHKDEEKTKEFDDLYFEDVSENDTYETEVKSRVTKVPEKKFEFPTFDDNDFMSRDKKEKEPKIDSLSNEPILYQGSKKKKDEVKKFKPSPIISPVFGLLDESGNKVEKEKAADLLASDKEDVSFDDVRKKAYGNLDDELDNTLKRLKGKTIEEAEQDSLKEDDVATLSRTKNKKNLILNKVDDHEDDEINNDTKEPLEDEDDDDGMILPNVNFKEIDVDEELKDNGSKDIKKVVKKKNTDETEDDDDTKEQDLFNLIDTIYSKEGKDE